MNLKTFFQLVLLAFLSLFVLTGCVASLPSFGVKKLEDSVSAPHPDQLRKNGEFITVFPLVFPPKLLVECVEVGFKGTWKIISIDQRDPMKKIQEGFAYFKKGSYEKTPWGLPLLEAVSLGKLKDLKNHRFILANRDGMTWLFSPMGKAYSQEEGYDFQKLEKDQTYRTTIFQEIGMSLEEIFKAWSKLRLIEKISLGEIKIDSPEWDIFEKEFLTSLKNSFTLASGEIIVSSSSKEQIQELIRTNPHLTGWQRFMERLYIPVVPSVEVLGFVGISAILNHGIRELTADPVYGGNSANSTITRKELATQFEFLVKQFNQKKD